MASDNIPLISVIIPVYNVEKYIRQCVDSILTQAFQDYELILVDDGSPDNCPAICDEYASADKRIKVIHKKNGGLSDARNKGILSAAGEYLLFIDSDDFIGEDSLLKIYEALKSNNEPDVVFLKAVRYYNESKINYYGGNYINKETFQNKDRIEIIKYLSVIPQFHLSACLKLVKRELIIKNNIFFTIGLTHEDVDWSIKLYLHADKSAGTEHTHYFYRQCREGSIMSEFSEKGFEDVLFIIKKWTDLAQTEYKEFEKIIHNFLYHKYHMLMLMYNEKGNKKRKTYKPSMKKFSWLIDIQKRKETKVLKTFYMLFGLRLTCFLFQFYIRNIYRHEKFR